MVSEQRLKTELFTCSFLSPNTQFVWKHYLIQFSRHRHFAHFVLGVLAVTLLHYRTLNSTHTIRNNINHENTKLSGEQRTSGNHTCSRPTQAVLVCPLVVCSPSLHHSAAVVDMHPCPCPGPGGCRPSTALEVGVERRWTHDVTVAPSHVVVVVVVVVSVCQWPLLTAWRQCQLTAAVCRYWASLVPVRSPADCVGQVWLAASDFSSADALCLRPPSLCLSSTHVSSNKDDAEHL